jgi:hypothetical protein
MEEELEEVKRRIRKAEADLERAQNIGNVELELKIYDVLSLLLKEKERLTTGMAKLIMYNFEDRTNFLLQNTELRQLEQFLHRRRRLRNLSHPLRYFSTMKCICAMLMHRWLLSLK